MKKDKFSQLRENFNELVPASKIKEKYGKNAFSISRIFIPKVKRNVLFYVGDIKNSLSVYVNNKLAGIDYRQKSDKPFHTYLDLTPYLKYGKINEVKLILAASAGGPDIGKFIISKRDWNRCIKIRPYNLPWFFINDYRGLKTTSKNGSRLILKIVKNNPNVIFKMVNEFDDICSLCCLKTKKGCSKKQSIKKIDDIVNLRFFKALGLKVNQKIKASEALKLNVKIIKNINDFAPEHFEKGLQNVYAKSLKRRCLT
ncbi:MAG: DUF1284 domain-containing protein [Candidatus Firestonebacteria bacterium]